MNLIKKLTIFFALILSSVASNAINTNIDYYQAKEWSYKTETDSCYSKWEPIDNIIEFNFRTYIITIYSKPTQYFIIQKRIDSYNNTINYTFVNSNGDDGIISFQNLDKNECMIYIKYDDITIIYNTSKINI